MDILQLYPQCVFIINGNSQLKVSLGCKKPTNRELVQDAMSTGPPPLTPEEQRAVNQASEKSILPCWFSLVFVG